MRLVLTPITGRKSDVESLRMRNQAVLHVLFELFATCEIFMVQFKGFFMMVLGRVGMRGVLTPKTE